MLGQLVLMPRIESSPGPDMTFRFPLSFFCVCRKTQYKLLTLEGFGSFTKGQGFFSLGNWLQALTAPVSIVG